MKMAMTDEQLLSLVEEDSSSDFCEGLGEFGGYVSYSVQGDVLTVKAQACTDEEGDDLETTVRSWKLTPVPGQDAGTEGSPA